MVVALSGLAHSKPNQYEENMRSEKISRKFLYLKQIISEIYIYIAITPHHSEDSLQDTYKWGGGGEMKPTTDEIKASVLCGGVGERALRQVIRCRIFPS